jgi:tetratricopeptide (TPR) repeat protein
MKGLIFLAPIIFTLSLSGCGDKEHKTAVLIQSHLERSQAYANSGQYRAAIIEARNIIQKDSGNALGVNRLAEIQIQLGYYKSAASLLESSPDIADQHTQLLLAQAYSKLGKYQSAEQALTQYEQDGGELQAIDYLLIKNRLLAASNQLEQAINNLSALIAANPQQLEVRNALAKIYFDNRQINKAKALLDETLQLAPKNASALFLRAQLSYLENDVDGAERLLSHALFELPQTDILLPEKSQVLQALSSVMTQQGRGTEAKIYSELLADANPEASAAKSKFLKAAELLKSGSIAEAEQLLTELYGQYPSNELSSTLLGIIDYNKGNYQAASELLTANIDPETASSKILQATALSQLRSNQAADAVILLQEAVNYHPDNVKLLSLYGLAALQFANSAADGELALQKALALQPSNNSVRIALSKYYLARQQVAQAIAQLESAIDHKPTDINAIALYARAMLIEGNTTKSDKVIADLLKAQADDIRSHMLAGSYAIAKKDLPQAEQYFQRVLELDQDHLQASTALAWLAVEQGKFALASRRYQALIALAPNNPVGYKGQFTAYASAGQPEKAINSLKTLIGSGEQRNPVAAAVTAEYYLRHQQLDEAARYLELASAHPSDSSYIQAIASRLRLIQARQAYQQDKLQQARELLQLIPPTAKQDLPTTELRVKIEIAAGNFETAEQLLATMILNYPDHPAAILAHANLLDARGLKGESHDYLLSKWQQTLRPQLAEVIYRRLQPGSEQSQQFLQRWANLAADNYQPYFYLALQQQQQGQHSTAIDLYEKTLQRNGQQPVALNNLAWLYMEADNPAAVEMAERAYQLAPGNPAILDTYGWLLVQSGQVASGTEILEQALAVASAELRDDIQGHLDAAKKL